MADNTTLNTGTGGDVMRSKDRTGVKTQLVALDLDPSGTETLMAGKMPADLQPRTAGGCSNHHRVSAGSGDAANIKASAGQVYAVRVFNKGAAPAYVKLHNDAGTPTPGAGVVKTIGVQAGVGVNWDQPMGVAFSTGIAMSIVTGLADADSTGVTAGDVVVDVEYK